MKRMKDASFFVLLAMIMLVTGCIPTYKEFIPQQPVSLPHGTPHFTGTVDVHSIIKPDRMGFDIGYDLPILAYIDNAMLEEALKESVANSGLFTKVVRENADYVLDVWIDGVECYQPYWGIGDYAARVFSVWRLTGARDGKVLVCDFVDGKSLINTVVSAPRTKSLIAALKDSIQNGLTVLAGTSKEHLSAMGVAGIRPSMGSTVPEGLKEWENLVRKNWPGLRKGLSLEAVENTIGPVQKSGALERIYLKFRTWNYTQQSGTACRISLDEKSLTHYDKDMGVGLEIFPNSEGERDKIFPPYDDHAYVWDKNPPNTVSILGKEAVYYMTHLYVLKFNSEGLQSWVLR